MTSAPPASDPTPAPSPCPRRWTGWLLGVLVLALIVVVLTILFAPSQPARLILARSLPAIEAATGLDWSYDPDSVSVIGNRITIRDLALRPTAEGETIATIDELVVQVRWDALLSRQTVRRPNDAIRALQRIEISGATLNMQRTPAGIDLLTYLKPQPRTGPPAAITAAIVLNDLTLHYVDFPLNADGSRDWSSPLAFDFELAGEARMHQGLLTASRLDLASSAQPSERLARIEGSADFAHSYAVTVTPSLELASLEAAGLWQPLLRLLPPAAAQELRQVQSARLSGDVLISDDLPAGTPEVAGTLALDQLALTHPLLGADPATGQLTLELHPALWQIREGLLEHDGHRVQVQGSIDPLAGDWPVDLAVDLIGLNINELATYVPELATYNLQGLASLRADIEGPAANPHVRGQVTSPGLTIAGETFELLRAPLEYGAGVVRGEASLRQGARSVQLVATGAVESATYGLQAEVRQLNAAWIRRLLPQLKDLPLTGPVSGTVTVMLEPGREMQTESRLFSTEGVLAGFTYETLLAQIRTEGSGVQLDRVAIALPGDQANLLLAHGGWDPDTGFDMHVDAGGLDLARLVPAAPVRGMLYGHVDLSGTPEAPHGDFAVRLVEGELGGVEISSWTQSGVVTPTALRFADSAIVFQQGTAALRGEVDLLAEDQVDLALVLTRLDLPTAGPVEVRGLTASVTLLGPLDRLLLESTIAGNAHWQGTAIAISEDDPLELEMRGEGVELASLPRSWPEFADQLGAWAGNPTGRLSLTHSGAVQLTSRPAIAGIDVYLRRAILSRAPRLAPLLGEVAGGTGQQVPIEGTLEFDGAWAFAQERPGSLTAAGESEVIAESLRIGQTTLLATYLRVSKEIESPLQVRLASASDQGGLAQVSGTLEPAGDTLVANLGLTVEAWPLRTLIAITSPSLATQIDATLSGSGRLHGPLDNLTTAAISPDESDGIRLAVADGHIANLDDLAGEIVIGFQTGELRIIGFRLTDPAGFEAKGTGTIYLAAERFNDSRATFGLFGLQLADLQPLLGPDGPAISGELEASANYAILEGIPGIGGQITVRQPTVGPLALDLAQALVHYNPFAKRLTIARDQPLFFEKQGYRVFAHGLVRFLDNESPKLELEVETPTDQAVLPLNAFFPNTQVLAAEGGLEGLFLRVNGTFAKPMLYGEALVGLRNVRLLGQPFIAEVTGPANNPGFPAVIVFEGQSILLEQRQFWLVNSANGRTGRLALEGHLDFGALMGGGTHRQIASLVARPESPGAAVPLTGFGLDGGLLLPDPDAPNTRPLRASFTGRALELSGNLTLTPGSLNLGGLTKLMGNATTSASEAGPAAIGPPVVYQLTLNVPEDYQITGPIDLELALEAGSLELTGSALAPSLVGIIRAKSGSLDLIGHEFRLVDPATLSFSSAYALDPRIVAVAETKVQTPDPTTLSGYRTVIVRATVNAQFQDLGGESGEGITFSSNDPYYATNSQILALLAGFGGDRSTGAQDQELGQTVLQGLGNAAVSIPGQFIGQLFEEGGFRRFLIGTNIDGDLTVDAEYELTDDFALDYSQTFGTERDWEAGVRYEFRNNSFLRIGTNEDSDIIGTFEYRIPLDESKIRASRAEVAAELHALAEREAAKDVAAQTPQDPATAADDDAVIEEHPGQPEVEGDAVVEVEEELAEGEAD